jgi:hypothetical protein
VTAHTFAAGFSHSQLLAFKSCRGSHTGQLIADEMENIAAEWNITDRVRYTVTDNASNMKKAMNIMFSVVESDETLAVDSEVDFEFDDPTLWGDLSPEEMQAAVPGGCRRIPCFAHSIQLVVRDGLIHVGFAKTAISKSSKLANLVHQSALFRTAFEDRFGVTNKSIPATNDTRWNSVFNQLKAIVDLDQSKLSELLRENSHSNLVMTTKEFASLKELVAILEPFAEATNLAQGEYMITISCVVPVLLSLDRQLRMRLNDGGIATPLIHQLMHGLHERFRGLYQMLDVESPVPLKTSRDLDFDDNVFLVATAIDPDYGFRFLIDHPGTDDERTALRLRITGMYY